MSHHAGTSGSMTSYSQRPRTAAGASGRRPKNPGPALSCNRCRKALETTVFLCSCNCIFCKDCTYEHFQKSADCPTCRRVLTDQDFLELTISKDESSSMSSFEKFSFQHLLTKTSSGGSTRLHLQEMCARSKIAVRHVEREMSFMLKQIRMSCGKMVSQTGHLKRNFAAMQQDNKQLQQTSSTERMEAQRALKDMQGRVQAMAREIAECEKDLQEKDATISKFERFPPTPGSAYSYGSSNGGEKRHRTNLEDEQPSFRSSHDHDRDSMNYRTSHDQEGRGPLQSYMHKKELQEQQERAQRDGYSTAKLRRPVLGLASSRSRSRSTSPRYENAGRYHGSRGNGGGLLPRPMGPSTSSRGVSPQLRGPSRYGYVPQSSHSSKSPTAAFSRHSGMY